MTDILVCVEAQVNSTEDLDKVKRAVENIFGSLDFEVKSRTWDCLLTFETKNHESLKRLADLISRERIGSAARKVFFSGLDNNSITFYLNKQVAFAGHISFSQQTAESPLGPIKVQVHCKDPRKLIHWLTPKPTTTQRKMSLRKR